MTENLAGRGEGLKGLASELQALADRTYAPGGPGHEEFEKGLRTAYLIAAGRVQKLAALEAAALLPASQAETDCRAILMLMGAEPYLAKGHVEDGEYQWTVVADKISVTEMLRTAALATPSPQAPPEQSNAFFTTSAREQSSATASANPSVGDEVTWIGQEGKRFTERIRRITEPQPGNYVFWVGENEFPINHREVERAAATQERPAGSEASKPVRLGQPLRKLREIAGELAASSYVTGQKATAKLIRQCVDEIINLMLYEEPGSPRKVGEDGASELLRVLKAALRQTSCDGDLCMYEWHEDARRIISEIEEVRPSSVPVGEQKQEEGV